MPNFILIPWQVRIPQRCLKSTLSHPTKRAHFSLGLSLTVAPARKPSSFPPLSLLLYNILGFTALIFCGTLDFAHLLFLMAVAWRPTSFYVCRNCPSVLRFEFPVDFLGRTSSNRKYTALNPGLVHDQTLMYRVRNMWTRTQPVIAGSSHFATSVRTSFYSVLRTPLPFLVKIIIEGMELSRELPSDAGALHLHRTLVFLGKCGHSIISHRTRVNPIISSHRLQLVVGQPGIWQVPFLDVD